MLEKCRKFLSGLLALAVVVTMFNIPIIAQNDNGLMLYVDFDNNINDKSGNNNHGKSVGDLEYVDGVKGKAIHIVNKNGSTSNIAEQYIDFGDKIKFGTDDFAISYWYKSDNGVSAGGAMISNKNFDSGENPGFTIGNFNTGLRVNFTASDSGRKDVYNFAPIDGVWHQVTVNFDRDGNIEAYLDGQSAGSTDISGDIGKSIDVANFIVGADGYTKNGLDNAYIDELAVYNRLMTKSEIEAACNITNIDDDEILHLDFNNENAKDSSGHDNDGTEYNITYVDGIDGKAARIVNDNGSSNKVVNSYIDFGTDSVNWLGKDDFTISFWYKTEKGNEDGGTIIANKDYDSGKNNGFAVGSFTENIRANFALNKSRVDQKFNNDTVNGDWHHNVIVYDRDGNMSVYTDGVCVGEKNIDTFVNQSIDTGNLMIGADINKKYGLLDSSIDEVRIFKTIKSSDEIANLYNEFNNSVEPKDDLLLYAAFNGNAKDSGNNQNHGKVVGNVSYVSGIKGEAVHIVNTNGSTSATAEQYIDFGNKIKFYAEDFSISYWYKSDNGVSAGGAMISNKNFNSGGNPGFNIGNFDTGLRVNFTASGSGRKDVYNFAPIDGVWHQVTVNFDRDGNIEAYLDGQSAGSTDISGDVGKSIDVANFVVGADGYGKNGLDDAYIDELKVYSRLISEDEIQNEYKIDYLNYVVYEATGFYNEAIKNTKYDSFKLASLKVEVDKGVAAIESNDYSEANTISATINSKMEAAKEGVEGVVDGQVLYLSFDNENTNDESGRGNNGDSIGDISYTDGVIGKAIHIQNDNGSTMNQAKQYVNFGQPDDLKFTTEDFSISFWYKTENGGGKEAAIISNKDWSTGGNVGMNIGNFNDSIRVNYTAEGNSRDDIYGLYANDDNWHYIVVNFDRDDAISAYIDGNLEKKANIKETFGNSIDATDFVIGADGNKTQGINDAYLDEVRVMKRLMNESEIEDYYLPFRLNMKIDEYTKTLEEAKKDGYDATKISEFEKVLVDVNEDKKGADAETIRQLIRKLTNAYDRFQISETPIISFQVLSDVHIDGTSSDNKSRLNLIDALEDISVLDPTSSLVMFPGDFTDSGSEAQYGSFYDILEQFNFTESLVALGNHDVRWLCSGNDRNEPSLTVGTCKEGTSPFKERYLKYNSKYMGENAESEKLYFDRWIDGYHFITLNTESDLKDQAYLSEEQLGWLEETLKVNASKDKPIFIQIHQSFSNDGVREDLDLIGEQEKALTDILKEYPQSIIFTGHIHNGINLAKVYNEEYGHVVDMPAFKYQSYGDSRAQIGYQINVFEDKVEIKPRDYKNDVWLSEYNTTITLEKVEVDFTKLSEAVKAAEKLLAKTDIYTKESLSLYEVEVNKAKDVLNNQNATQQLVNDALSKLQEAKNILSEKVDEVDKSKLIVLYNEWKDIAKNEYTDDSYALLQDALKAARNVIEDNDVTQDDVDEAYAALVNAVNSLEIIIVDKSELEDMIIRIQELIASKNKEDYTEESWNGLLDALDNAENIMNDETVSEEDVLMAIDNLMLAEKNLTEKAGDETKPTPVDPKDPESTNKNDVNTNDTSNKSWFVSLALLALCCMFNSKRSKLN